MTARRWAVLGLLATTQLIGVADFSIVNVALPTIGKEFQIGTDELQWVPTAYGLMQAGFVLLGGRLFDVYDRKRVFLVALAVFGAASLAGGLARTPLFLFGARGLQGLAGAVVAPGSLALVTDEFAAGPERHRALGVFGTVASLGFILGTIAGGFLTGLTGWRSVFFINVPLVVAIIAGLAVALHTKAGDQPRPRLDVRGAVVGSTAMLALLAGVSGINGGAVRAGVPIAMAAVLAAVFIGIERNTSDALVPFAIFRSREFTAAVVSMGISNVGFLMVPFTLTYYFQGLLGFSAQETGLLFVPTGVGGIAGGLLAPMLIRHVGLRNTVVAALSLLAGVNVVIVGPGMHAAHALIPVAMGIGGMLVIGSLVSYTIAATSAMEARQMGLAAGLLNTSQFLGGAIGTATAGAIDLPSTLDSYVTAFLVALALVIAMAVTSAVAFGGRQPAPEVMEVRP
jgi:MFS family permease